MKLAIREQTQKRKNGYRHILKTAADSLQTIPELVCARLLMQVNEPAPATTKTAG